MGDCTEKLSSVQFNTTKRENYKRKAMTGRFRRPNIFQMRKNLEI